jgi:hypothetical protein
LSPNNFGTHKPILILHESRMRTKRTWVIYPIILSALAFIFMIMAHSERLRYAPAVFQDAMNGKEWTSDARLVVGQFSFYAVGLLLAVLILLSLATSKYKPSLRWLLWGYGAYFLLFVALELPLYQKHSGFAGTILHGHSFWTGFHLH